MGQKRYAKGRGPRALSSRHPVKPFGASRCQILEGQNMTAPTRRRDDVEIAGGWCALTDEPRMHGCIRQPKVSREGGSGLPDELELFHINKLRNMRSCSQYANRSDGFAICAAMIGAAT